MYVYIYIIIHNQEFAHIWDYLWISMLYWGDGILDSTYRSRSIVAIVGGFPKSVYFRGIVRSLSQGFSVQNDNGIS
jgi:hypothetical protein